MSEITRTSIIFAVPGGVPYSLIGDDAGNVWYRDVGEPTPGSPQRATKEEAQRFFRAIYGAKARYGELKQSLHELGLKGMMSPNDEVREYARLILEVSKGVADE